MNEVMKAQETFQIRAMKLEDLDQVMALEQRCFSMPWPRSAFQEELTKNPLAHYLVVTVRELVVGYAGIWLVFDEGHITNVAVDPAWRQRGLAKQLLSVLLANARGCNIVACTLEVRRSNLPALRLYQQFGFVEEGCREGYYTDNKEDALILWKRNMNDCAIREDWLIPEAEEEGKADV
ncbi:MAG: ribosomal protein S18-alanine N-acetyltransferase [Negativicutes bacterium]|nr:ribosomal protein S18-alanine N-acetyltransferase [Negativicutes bacterium]